MGLRPSLFWKVSNCKEQRVSGNNPLSQQLHTLCTALIASHAPLLYNTTSPFTMELRKVTMPFKLRSKREGWACCLSRRARQCLGVVGRESRSSFTWNHVNSTLHTRSTTSSGSPRNTPALSSRRTLHHCLSVTIKEHYTQHSPHLTP